MGTLSGKATLPISFCLPFQRGLTQAVFPHGRVKIKLTLKVLKTKITEFANRVDLDEVAHDEPPHLDLHCLPPYSLDLTF